MIQLKNATVRFGEKAVLDDFSFTLPETGVTCLLGPSGCGKTTLARVLAGLQTLQTGTLTGIAPGQTAFVFQEDRLLPWLTARENVAAVLPKARRGEADRFLADFELPEAADLLPRELSGGMQRRVALARGFAYGGNLLILDEPFKGLDQDLARRLYPLVLEAARTKPVLLITHHPQEAEALGTVLRLSGPPLVKNRPSDF